MGKDTKIGAERGAGRLDEMTEAKLWNNPCWLTYRLNYLALRYNLPLYSWVERTYGLSRPEFVVIFSLGLKDGAVARDIATSSGFPKNTLSRAIHKLVGLGLIDRAEDSGDRRRVVLTLTESGRALFDEALPRFVGFEHMMLEALTPEESATLSSLMAKLVQASSDWPTSVDDKRLSSATEDPASQKDGEPVHDLPSGSGALS